MHSATNQTARPENQGVLKVMSRLLNEKALDASPRSHLIGRGPKCEDYPIELGGSGEATRISPIRTEGWGLKPSGPFRLQENLKDSLGADCGRTDIYYPEIQEPAGPASAGDVDSGMSMGRGDSRD